MTDVKASVKSVPYSPRKVGEVAALVRGRSVEDALTILEHTPRSAALPLRKLIGSAKANAINNLNLSEKSLHVTALDIGPGPSLKRFRPAAHGRALAYRRRTTTMRVILRGDAVVKKPRKSTAAKTEGGDK